MAISGKITGERFNQVIQTEELGKTISVDCLRLTDLISLGRNALYADANYFLDITNDLNFTTTPSPAISTDTTVSESLFELKSKEDYKSLYSQTVINVAGNYDRKRILLMSYITCTTLCVVLIVLIFLVMWIYTSNYKADKGDEIRLLF